MVEAELSHTCRMWDRKDTDSLKRLFNQHSQDPQWIYWLEQRIVFEEEADACSWLLKHSIENGASFNESFEKRFWDYLSSMSSWPSQLHMLQLVDYVYHAPENVQTTKNCLHLWLGSERPLVRAWTYNALIRLAYNKSLDASWVESLVSMAEQDEKASVKARIRNALKKYPFL